jgi:hypothetical protein
MFGVANMESKNIQAAEHVSIFWNYKITGGSLKLTLSC